MRRYLFQTLILLSATTIWLGCDKDDDDDDKTVNSYTLSGPASGTQERPTPVTTNATGTISGSYNVNTKVLDYMISWSNLSADPAAMHFHGPAGPEETALPVVPIENFPVAKTGMHMAKDTLTTEQETQLLTGKWYYNIHTSTYPGGEIRGQITTTAD